MRQPGSQARPDRGRIPASRDLKPPPHHNERSRLGFKYIVLCIDEAERFEPYALSALKNALLELDSYLVVLSVRLAQDLGDPQGAGRQRLEEIAVKADRDLGAARIYITRLGLGSFTLAQARECITRRLEGNAISFNEKVTDLIARVAGGLPDHIISYANEVYDHVASNGAQIATPEDFRVMFTVRHQIELDEARALRAQSTGFECRLLRELARAEAPLTPLELAGKLHPDVAADVLQSVADAIIGVLDRVNIALCRGIGGRYMVPDPVRRYALEMAMESA